MEKTISNFIAVLLGLLVRLRSKLDELSSKMSAADDDTLGTLRAEAYALHSKIEEVFEMDVNQHAALEEHVIISDAIDALKTWVVIFHHQLFRELNLVPEIDTHRLDWIFEEAAFQIAIYDMGNPEDRFYEIYNSIQISVNGYDKMVGYALDAIMLNIYSLGDDQHKHLRGPFFDLLCRILAHVVVRYPGSTDNWEYGCIYYFLPLGTAYPEKRVIQPDGTVETIKHIPMRDISPAKALFDGLRAARKGSASTGNSQSQT